ncbi:glutaredoxin, grx [Culex quinquefasciatus]|uniref:Glutaredoxin, grx n=1 Tax=Culex quinquefasciatus TaxID=7176 RepID=B0WV41_CULQU|nr:glutaredoxin, grx [Culex quinquefasciatus]|eukprot:XP_001860838.1 glutaredoxin, grx [Culex quinquefasciatus]
MAKGPNPKSLNLTKPESEWKKAIHLRSSSSGFRRIVNVLSASSNQKKRRQSCDFVWKTLVARARLVFPPESTSEIIRPGSSSLFSVTIASTSSSMAITIVTSVDQYNKLISSPALTVALFSADWAEQCKQILTVMTELAKQFSAVQFVDVPADELFEVVLKHQIDAVPTVNFFQVGKAVDRIDGVDIAALTTKCRKLAGAATSVGGPRHT